MVGAPRNRLVLLVAFVVSSAFGIGCGSPESLRKAPGYALEFPAGSLITVFQARGLLGAPSQEDRIYGTSADPRDVASYWKDRLTAAGYRQVSAPEKDGPGDRFLGRYKQGNVAWFIIVRPLPQRIDGHTYVVGERGFQRVVVVRIEA